MKKKLTLAIIIFVGIFTIIAPRLAEHGARHQLLNMGIGSHIDKSEWKDGGFLFTGVHLDGKNPNGRITGGNLISVHVDLWKKLIRIRGGNLEVKNKLSESANLKESSWKVEIESIGVSVEDPRCKFVRVKSLFKSGNQFMAGAMEAECYNVPILANNILIEPEKLDIGLLKVDVQNPKEVWDRIREPKNRENGSTRKRKITVGEIEILTLGLRVRVEKAETSQSGFMAKDVSVEDPGRGVGVSMRETAIDSKNGSLTINGQSVSLTSNAIGYKPVKTEKFSMVMSENKHVEITVGDVSLSLKMNNEPGWELGGIGEINGDCQKVMKLTPASDDFANFEVQGEIFADLNIQIRPNKTPKKLREAKVKIRSHNGCKFVKIPEVYETVFRGGVFEVDQIQSGGEIRRVTTGPGTPEWVSYSEISPNMTKAILVTEDAGFFSHRGVSLENLSDALREDIELGRFRRGGSTITMQLAKNLWLQRDKTLSRKIQEFFLTQLLEQKWDKKKILEYYFNIVEFGPNLYGIRNASEVLFASKPSNLTLTQSIALAVLLPSPKAKVTENGKVTNAYAGQVQRILGKMLSEQKISGSEYEAASEELKQSESLKWETH